MELNIINTSIFNIIAIVFSLWILIAGIKARYSDKKEDNNSTDLDANTIILGGAFFTITIIAFEIWCIYTLT